MIPLGILAAVAVVVFLLYRWVTTDMDAGIGRRQRKQWKRDRKRQ